MIMQTVKKMSLSNIEEINKIQIHATKAEDQHYSKVGSEKIFMTARQYDKLEQGVHLKKSKKKNISSKKKKMFLKETGI